MLDSQGPVRVTVEPTKPGRASWVHGAVFTIVAWFWSLIRDSSVDSVGSTESAAWGRAPDESNASSRYAKHLKNALDDPAVQ